MISLKLDELVSMPETLLALEPEELAGIVLNELVARAKTPFSNKINQNEFVSAYKSGPREVRTAIIEAWMWLEREGCIAPDPDIMGAECVFVTRRGRELAEAQDFSSFNRERFLPKEFLHPIIAQKVWAPYIRGEFDTAVFQAFKQIEVSVRDASSLAPEDIGVKLMRKAFDVEAGPLRDVNATSSERQALSDLFSGAIGSYKNPQSHRNVSLNDPKEAAEMIILASHLLKIVDSRQTK
jgi:uncharacterized protein (TIGR02391 family)